MNFGMNGFNQNCRPKNCVSGVFSVLPNQQKTPIHFFTWSSFTFARIAWPSSTKFWELRRSLVSKTTRERIFSAHSNIVFLLNWNVSHDSEIIHMSPRLENVGNYHLQFFQHIISTSCKDALSTKLTWKRCPKNFCLVPHFLRTASHVHQFHCLRRSRSFYQAHEPLLKRSRNPLIVCNIKSVDRQSWSVFLRRWWTDDFLTFWTFNFSCISPHFALSLQFLLPFFSTNNSDNNFLFIVHHGISHFLLFCFQMFFSFLTHYFSPKKKFQTSFSCNGVIRIMVPRISETLLCILVISDFDDAIQLRRLPFPEIRYVIAIELFIIPWHSKFPSTHPQRCLFRQQWTWRPNIPVKILDTDPSNFPLTKEASLTRHVRPWND